MISIDARKAQQMKRASQRAGWISLFGVLFVIAALGMSGWKLKDLQLDIKKTDQQLDDKRAALDMANVNLDTTRVELAELERKREELEANVESLETDVGSLQEQWDVASIQIQQQYTLASELPNARLLDAPITAVVRPQADYETIANPDDASVPLYDFVCWLDVPQERSGEIERVSYFFNHRSFPQQVMESDEPANGFRVNYRGWGALDRVIITLHLSDGSSQRIAYNMLADIRGVNALPANFPTRVDPRKFGPTKGEPIRGEPVKGDPIKGDPRRLPPHLMPKWKPRDGKRLPPGGRGGG